VKLSCEDHADEFGGYPIHLADWGDDDEKGLRNHVLTSKHWGPGIVALVDERIRPG